MSENFKISPNMTKAKLIEQYEALLDAYTKSAAELEAARKARTDAEEQLRKAALEIANEATVEGVITSVGRLRGQVGKTLNELLEAMSARAEEVERLNRAVELKKAELKELHDIEVSASTFSKLMATYQEEREAAEREYAARLEALQTEYQQRSAELEATFTAQKEALEKEITEARAAWAHEKEQAEAEQKEYAQQLKKQREREEADYLYERDRTRRLEANELEEKRAAQDKELKERLAAAEREVTERLAAVEAREAELASLQDEVAAFPKRLQAEVEAAAKAAREAALHDAQQKAAMAALERQWETKVFKERIVGLEKMLADRDGKLAELKAQLDTALRQVQQIAEKVVSASSFGDPGVNRAAAAQTHQDQGE
ncbi:MAG: hypothetical protein GXP48_02470 [Acidobacteria bacterium]|nr:hypothetical protein [Acidobacteriota bacterium]